MDQNNQHDIIDLKEIIQIIISRKKLILFSILICAVIAWLYGISRPPVYKSSVLINITGSAGPSTDLSSVINSIPSLSSSNSTIDKQTEIIKSKRVLRPVVENLHLDVIKVPKSLPIIGRIIANHYNTDNGLGMPNKPWFGMNEYDWGGASVSLSKFEVSPGFINTPFTLIKTGANQYNLLADGTIVLENAELGKQYYYQSEADFLEINVKRIYGNKGQIFTLTKISDDIAIKQLSAGLKISEVTKGSGILSITYQGSTPKQVANILNSVAERAIAADIQLKSKNAETLLSFLKSQLPKVEQELDQAQENLNAYRSRIGSISIQDEARLVLNSIANYDKRISELEFNKSQIAQKLTPNNPELKQVDAAIEKIKSQRSIIENKIKAMPQSDQIFVNLSRQATVQSELYQNLLQKIRQYSILEAGTVSSLQVLDPAEVPYHNINQPLYLIVFIGALLGAFLSILWIFLQTYLFKGIQNPEEIEALLNAPSLGTLFKNRHQAIQAKKMKKQEISHLRVLAEIDLYDATLESLRSLKTALALKIMEAQKNIICITGPTQGIGKSFVSANLANVLANDKKILLIDADLRRGHLDHYFQVKPSLGLTEYLNEEVTLEEIISKTRFENLDFIQRGAFQAKSSELLTKTTYNALLSNVSKKYDYVIVDAPPILPVADTLLIIQNNTINLLIVSCSSHDKKEIMLTKRKLDQNKINIDGFVLNNVSDTSHYYLKKYHYRYK